MAESTIHLIEHEELKPKMVDTLKKSFAFSLAPFIDDNLEILREGKDHWKNYAAFKLLTSNNLTAYAQNVDFFNTYSQEALFALSTLGACNTLSLRALKFLYECYPDVFSKFIIFTIKGDENHPLGPLKEWVSHTMAIVKIRNDAENRYLVFSPANYYLLTNDGEIVKNPDFEAFDLVKEENLAYFLQRRYGGNWDNIDSDELESEIEQAHEENIVSLEVNPSGLLTGLTDEQIKTLEDADNDLGIKSS